MRLSSLASTLAALLLAAAPARAEKPVIRHEAAACVLAESYPRIAAVIAHADRVAKARVFFRPELAPAMPVATSAGPPSSRPGSGGTLSEKDPLDGGGGDRAIGDTAWQWYAVAMVRGEGDAFTAVLPRPRMAARKVRYFIEATDDAAAPVRDREQVVEVVGAEGACGGARVLEAVSSARVVVEVPPGAPLVPPVPQGFSPVGASAVQGSVVAQKSRHKGLFLGLGAAALGGAAAVSQSSGGSSPAPPGPPAPGITLVTTIPSSGGVVSVSRPTMEVRLRVVPPEDMQGGALRARLYGAADPSRTCGRMRASTFGLSSKVAQVVRLFVLEEGAPCGPVDRVQVTLEDAQGREVLSTGTTEPDLVISLVFAP